MNKQFETTLETHNIPTDIKVIDQPYSVWGICYDTFKEFFVDAGYETKEKWELYLEDFSDCDQDWICEIEKPQDITEPKKFIFDNLFVAGSDVECQKCKESDNGS